MSIDIKNFYFPESKYETLSYLSSYYLNDSDYLIYGKIIRKIFKDVNFKKNEVIFEDDFFFKDLKKGMLFSKTSFNSFLKFLKEINNEEGFVIIQDIDKEDLLELNEPHLRFKFPNNISWEEINLISDGQILKERLSYELFGRPIRNYFIFDCSGKWGIYVGLDFLETIKKIGYKSDLSDAVTFLI